MNTIPLDSALVQGYIGGDPLAAALVIFVSNNADRGSIGSPVAAPLAASYINPLQDVEDEQTRSGLIFVVETTDPDSGEFHAIRTADENYWRIILARLRKLGWRPITSILLSLRVPGTPSGFRSRSPHIRAA